MKDGLISRPALAISLGMCHDREAGLVAQVVEVVRELVSAKLSAIIEDSGVRDAKSGDYVAPYEFTHLGGGYRCDGLDFDPLGIVVHRHKKILVLACGLGKRAKDVHSPCGEWEGADYRCHSGGGDSLNCCEPLTLVTSPHYRHCVLSQTRPIVAGSYGRDG